jgi:hypothetical protein
MARGYDWAVIQELDRKMSVNGAKRTFGGLFTRPAIQKTLSACQIATATMPKVKRSVWLPFDYVR